MKYDIVTYGVPVLRQRANPVAVIDHGIRNLAEDMLEHAREQRRRSCRGTNR